MGIFTWFFIIYNNFFCFLVLKKGGINVLIDFLTDFVWIKLNMRCNKNVLWENKIILKKRSTRFIIFWGYPWWIFIICFFLLFGCWLGFQCNAILWAQDIKNYFYFIFLGGNNGKFVAFCVFFNIYIK